MNKKDAEALRFIQPHIAEEAPDQIQKAAGFCEGYKRFLDKGKTERECVREAEKLLIEAGYEVFDENKKYLPGAKIYTVNRKKAIMAATIGTESLKEGMHINVAHIDSPRLDLKPNPLYEDHDISLLKTHYYGGIRKYQWASIPLAIHGVVVKQDGETVEICIGENPEDPVFCVTDLLPHLSGEQDKRTLKDGLRGEELNVIFSSLPFPDDKDMRERIKIQALVLLNQYYGITDRDFVCGELEVVPAFKAKDVGIDRSMIGAYGQDDRVCAYTALMAEIEVKSPKYTTLMILADKEEIGSVGNTGLDSFFAFHFIEYLAEMEGVNYKTLLRNSKCLSADVNAAYDPTFPSVMDPHNSCYINKGTVVTKYTGAGGKGGTSDASAEFMSYVTRLLNGAGVYWQTGELGAVDAGGGGTVAKFAAAHNIEVVDLGVPILSMHSPFELSAKLDVYNTYAAFKAFLE